MNQEKLLTKEIIKRIFGNLGIVPNNNYGKFGITIDDFYVGENIELFSNDSEVTYHKIYCGSSNIDNFNIRVVLVSLGGDPKEDSNDACEFLVLIKTDDSPIHGLSLCFDDNDCGTFLMRVKIKDEQESWIPASVLIQSQILTGMEQITQMGVMWIPCKEYADLKGDIFSMLERI